MANKKTLYIEDDVLNNLEQDNFGHRHIADAIVDSIINTKPPYIVGIFGGWGSGKSSLLGMIDKELQKANVLTVTIDAWRYSASENLRRAFLVHVANELAPGLLSDLRRKLYTSEQETLPGNVVNKFDSSRPLSKAIWNIAYKSILLTAVVFIIVFLYFLLVTSFQHQTFQEIWKNIDWESLLDAFVKVAFIPLLWPVLSDLGLYIIHRPVTVIHERIDADELFAEYFRKVVEESTSKGILSKKRLVVFVDNLDRLTDDKMVDALESLKTYLDNDNCVFVVACDDNVVRSVINKSNKIPGSRDSETADSGSNVERRAGEHYLDKFFQQTFRLPEYMGINLHDFAMENLRTTNIFDELTVQKVDVQNLVSIILPSDVGSPRKVKRLLNEFIALYEIVKRRENENNGQLRKGTLSDNLEFLGKFSTLRAEYPSFYKSLTSETGLLISITNLIQQNIDVAKENLTKSGVENVLSLLSYLRKTQTIMVNDIDPYVWLSQDMLALGLKGNDYSQLRKSLADGNVDEVKGLLESSDDTDYKIRLAKVASRLVAQRLVGIERQNGAKVMSHLLSQFDDSVRSEIANAVANIIPDFPVDVFSANEILSVIRWAHGIGISTQKNKLITQIISRLEHEKLREDTFEAILQNADVIDSNFGTSRVQQWLAEILTTQKQDVLKDGTDENSEDKNLPNRQFAEWLISQINNHSSNTSVVDNYYSHDLVKYAVFRLLGTDNILGVYLNEEGLGKNINTLFQVLANRIEDGAEDSRYWDGILAIIDGTNYYADLKFAVDHVTNLTSHVPENMIEKIVVGSLLVVEELSKRTDSEKIEDQMLSDILRDVLELINKLRERKGQEFDAVECEKLPVCISELMLVPSLQNILLDFLSQFAEKYGVWDADLFTGGILLALSKTELRGEVEKKIISRVLDLDSFVNNPNREKVLARIDMLISTNEQDKIDYALEFLEEMVSLDEYHVQIENISKSWLEKLGSDAIDVLQSKTNTFDLLMTNRLLSPDDYADRVIKLLPFGGDAAQLQVVFDEIDRVSNSISQEMGKTLISAVLANIAVLGKVCPKTLAVGSLWIESVDDAERLSFDSNIVSLYESSPNVDLPIHLVSWAKWTSDEIRNHLVQIYRIEVDSSLVTNRDQATLKAMNAMDADKRKESVLFIWAQLVNDRDAAEIFINVVKGLLSYDEIIDIRKDAVGVVRENTDPALSINNLRLLASTIRDDIDDVDRIVDLFINLFGRGADDVQMAVKHVVPCLSAFRLTKDHKYGLAEAMSEAVTRSDEEIDLIESKARELRLEWFKHRKRRWFWDR